MNGGETQFEIEKVLGSLKLKSLGKRSSNWPSVKFVFIVSTGRTGTHFFSHFFTTNFNNVTCVHEPKKDVFCLNMAYLKNEISNELTDELFHYYRRRVLKESLRKKNQLYIESNNNLSFLIPYIQRYIPDYKIIYLVRDGRDFVKSGYSKKTSGKWTGGDVFLLSEKDPRNRINADMFSNDDYYGKWSQMNRFERVCWYWSRTNEILLKTLSDDENAMQVKFEDLFIEKNTQTWQELMDFIGLQQGSSMSEIINYVSHNQSNSNKSYALNNWSSWTSNQHRIFKEIAGVTLEKLGYAMPE